MRSSLIYMLSTLLLVGAASAELVDLGNVTRDTTTDLEWLDLTESLDLSYFAVVNGSGNDLAAQGWRHATATDVCALFAEYALAAEPCGVDNRTASQADTGAVQALMNLLGDTGAVIAVSSTTQDPIVVGSVGFVDDDDGNEPVGQATLGHHLTNGTEQTAVFVNWLTQANHAATQGHFLVRTVPEPSAGLGGSIALLTLLWLRRTRARLS
jgi:hypothetical protein